MEQQANSILFVIEVDSDGNVVVKGRDGLEPEPCAVPPGAISKLEVLPIVAVAQPNGKKRVCIRRPDGTWQCYPR